MGIGGWSDVISGMTDDDGNMLEVVGHDVVVGKILGKMAYIWIVPGWVN